MKWKVLESNYLHKENWLTLRKDKCLLPNGKVVPAYYVLEYPSWVNALALTKEGKVILVKQYRHGLGEISIELPGGVVDKGETPEAAVIRELTEETGYEFKHIEYIGKICANPATSNNYTYMYIAKEGEKAGEQQLDETEEVEVVVMDINELKLLLRKNIIIQSLHVSCIFYALEKLGLLSY